MSVFFVMGEDVVTPQLSGTILPGITRDSVITLLRDIGYRLREERISIDEVFRSHERDELRECFGTGTAATVSHVKRIRYNDQTIELPGRAKESETIWFGRNCWDHDRPPTRPARLGRANLISRP